MGKRSICHQGVVVGISRVAILLCVAAYGTAAQAQTPQQDNTPQSGQPAADKPLPEAPEPQTPQAQEPEAPRNENGPVGTLEGDTKKAAELTEQMATEELLRARDWEATWISGVYVAREQTLSPLTEKQREEIYLRQTFTTPQAYMKRMFEAAFDQARGVPAQWDDGWAGYAERFASREGQFIAANSLAALGNAKLGYEVRYDRCKCRRTWPRIRHAIVRNFLTYNHTEREMRPQWALYGGAFAGGMVATAWKPSPKDALANGAWAVVGQAGYGTLLNFVIEFSREINEKQGVR
jgi:pyruvate/2-oxoglutarate dehydrogenase complex dihydrolipoamide acyltransferase (E2) component